MSTAEAGARSPAAGSLDERIRLSDALWLALAVLLLVASALGTRLPWPADEPRFALLARDMVASGDWLFPRIGGDLYADKPLLYFWLLAAGYALTGSVRWSFLVPSFLAACGTVWLLYDLVRRLAGRRTGLGAALTLVFTVQFVMVMRAAQIDATLCFLTTLSLYGLLRHLMLGPQWGWYFIGGVAAGLGVITKGVGFLPLLALLPYCLLRARGFQPLPRFEGGLRWGFVALGFLLGVSVWLVPMLATVQTSGDPALIAYRNEILFHQTVNRYAASWHHLEPWYFFLVQVIPGLWLPVSLLLFWLVPRWRTAWRERNALVWLPLAWAVLVLVFFSCSPGKRGIYLMPALPAVILASTPYLEELFRRKGVQRASLVLSGLLVVGTLGVIAAYAVGARGAVHAVGELGLSSITPFVVFAILSVLGWLAAWRFQPLFAWPAVMAVLALVWSFGVNPRIDGERSARTFMQHMLSQVPQSSQLAFMGYKEQFLLYLDRPVVNFGHRRWLEGPKEAQDASRWLNEGQAPASDRVLLVPKGQLSPCFVNAPHISGGSASGETWYLVRPPASTDCALSGNPANTILYTPPLGKVAPGDFSGQ